MLVMAEVVVVVVVDHEVAVVPIQEADPQERSPVLAVQDDHTLQGNPSLLPVPLGGRDHPLPGAPNHVHVHVHRH